MAAEVICVDDFGAHRFSARFSRWLLTPRVALGNEISDAYAVARVGFNMTHDDRFFLPDSLHSIRNRSRTRRWYPDDSADNCGKLSYTTLILL